MRNKLVYGCLLFFSHITDNKYFAFFHFAIAWFYSEVICRVLQAYYRRKEVNLRIIARHSAKDPASFNAFSSDLDLSIVIDGSIEAERIKKDFKKIRKFLLFLGEIEIYTDEEYSALESLIKDFGYQYTSVRNLRKIYWMEQNYEAAKSDYHRFKALRAIGFCLKRLRSDKIPTSKGNYRNIAEEARSIAVTLLEPQVLCTQNLDGVYAEYFQATIYDGQAEETENDNLLIVDQTTAAVLLAVSPQLSFGKYSVSLAMENLRKSNARIFELWSAFCSMEYLIVTAVERGSPIQLSWVDSYLSEIQKMLGAQKQFIGDKHCLAETWRVFNETQCK